MREARAGCSVRLARAPLSHGRAPPPPPLTLRHPRASPSTPSHTFFRAIKVVSNISECSLVTFHRHSYGPQPLSELWRLKPRRLRPKMRFRPSRCNSNLSDIGKSPCEQHTRRPLFISDRLFLTIKHYRSHA